MIAVSSALVAAYVLAAIAVMIMVAAAVVLVAGLVDEVNAKRREAAADEARLSRFNDIAKTDPGSTSFPSGPGRRPPLEVAVANSRRRRATGPP